jgi:hypothetical protein
MSKGILELIRSTYLKVNEGSSYNEFLEFLETIRLSWQNDYSLEQLKEQFPDNSAFLIEEEDVEGDQIMEGVLKDPPDIGELVDEPINSWYDDDRFNSFKNSAYYKRVLLNSTDGMPDNIRLDVEKSGRQIVARCTDPRNWDRVRQGLVFGMVQSGKTLSMINVVNQAFHTGYRMVVLLAGDKNSLRAQGQDRFNDSFEIEVNNQKVGIHCPTSLEDLTRGPYRNDNGTFRSLDFFNTRLIAKKNARGEDWHILIVMKKQKHQLEELLRALEDFKQWFNDTNIDLSFEEDLPTLIIDDESHYASIDVNPTGTDDEKAVIHRSIKEICAKLPKHNYIGYTATPQSVIAANEREYNYPSDFIWLLEPKYIDDARRITSSYLGGNEFYHLNAGELLEVVSENVWPHNRKDWDGTNIPGVYYPGTDGDGQYVNMRLVDAESTYLDEIKDNVRATPEELITAATHFIVGGGIRWWNHYVKHLKSHDKYQNVAAVTTDIIQKKIPDASLNIDKEFPFHAIMFNMSYVTENHRKIAEVLEQNVLEVLKKRWKEYRAGTGVFRAEIDLVVKEIFDRASVDGSDDSRNEILFFIDKCLEIALKKIPGDSGAVYQVNSENHKLNYGKEYPDRDRVKKSAVVVGGNILAMGLTIEGLSVSFFTRTQNDSKMDTNLQMCRWFGHKRSYMYAIKLFTLQECVRIYRDIADADDQLRREIKKRIKQGYAPKNILLGIRNSAFFRATSAEKSYYIQGSQDEAFSGSVSSLLEPTFKRESILKNADLLEGLMTSLNLNGFEISHNRARLFRDVDPELMIAFFKKFNCKDNAINVSPSDYANYLEVWRRSDRFGELPKINVAIWGVDDNPSIGRRKRRFTPEIDASKHTLEDVKKMCEPKLQSLVGGRSDDGAFLGDRYLDFSNDWHTENKDKKGSDLSEIGWKARKEILIVFYLLDPNYLGNTGLKGRSKGAIYLEEGDEHYIDNNRDGKRVGMPTFMIVTPEGGPMWEVGANSTVTEVIKEEEEHID